MKEIITIGDISAHFREELDAQYGRGETDAFFTMSLEEYTGIPREEIRLRQAEKLKKETARKLLAVVSGLKTGKPLQYILGSVHFCGCKLRVNPHVLIPRPETEELVESIVKDPSINRDSSILDIGTGSGCIAIALKKKMPDATVSAIDISEDALLLAKANAILNHTKINFLQGDILNASNPALQEKQSGRFDIIVSNPPYVRYSEKNSMAKNVLDFEPHTALFVNDEDPLLFYRTIANFAWQHLSTRGRLYFEINEALGEKVKKLLEKTGFKNVEVRKDMSGKERMAVGSRL